MDPNTYQRATNTTEIYSEAATSFLNDISGLTDRYPTQNDAFADGMQILSLMYCAGKLNGEAGEVAEIIFKGFRGGKLEDDKKDKLFYELGDLMWYVSELCTLCGFKLSDVMLANIEKLQSRKERGVLHGYGSDR